MAARRGVVQDNQPTAQFYHVITDTATPYRVYGPQQDSGTVAIVSRSDDGSIDRSDWYDVGGGEAGYIAPDPRDPNIVYAADYQGNITRYDRHIGQVKAITEQPELSDAHGAANLEHRFQWTAPGHALSARSQHAVPRRASGLFKTTDGGVHWQAISPDLTRNDKEKQKVSGGDITLDDSGTEYYDTIFALAESPLKKGLLWVGTDDGLIQLTQDEGKTWTNVTPKDMPEWSAHQPDRCFRHSMPGTAYVAVDRHQFDDLRPYIYKTSDYGKTWTKLTQGIPDTTFVRVVREDPKKRGLLYAGTETGVVCFVQRRRKLAAAEVEPADHAGARPGDQGQRSGGRDPRSCVLDSRRYLSAPPVQRRHRAERRVPVHAGDGVPDSGGSGR